jgi:hypothetical protein
MDLAEIGARARAAQATAIAMATEAAPAPARRGKLTVFNENGNRGNANLE